MDSGRRYPDSAALTGSLAVPEIAGAIEWLQGLALSTWLRHSLYVFPALEILHVFGIILLAGPLIVLDLRLFGWFAALPISGAASLAPALPAAGLAIALVSGSLLFLADPAAYFENPALRLKLILIGIGLANAVAFHGFAHRRLMERAGDRPVPAGAKAMATVSLASWAGAIACGQWISYT